MADQPKSYSKPDANVLKSKLNPEQFEVTQMCGTEPPFRNAYWDHKKDGLYVDIVSGEPLFSSIDKYDSGTGWPSFTQPVDKKNITYHQEQDRYRRVEVRSLHGDSHLGHVFDDGPGPQGKRYCINSASLRFIPKEKLEEEGYGEYLKLFPETKSAVLAGGCFWGVEEVFRKIPGVVQTEVGYIGGTVENPTYRQVCTSKTGHAEAIEIKYDPSRVTYEELIRVFFRMHDPTTPNRQHNDVGPQYRSAIFTSDPSEKEIARKVIAELNGKKVFDKPIVTEVNDADIFYSAEEEHQDYLQKNPGGYNCHVLRP